LRPAQNHHTTPGTGSPGTPLPAARRRLPPGPRWAADCLPPIPAPARAAPSPALPLPLAMRRRRAQVQRPVQRPGRTCNGTGTHVKPVRGGQTGGSGGPPAVAGLDSVEIRLAGTAGPSGHLGQLDEPAEGVGGLAVFGSGAGEPGGGGGLLRRGGDGGAVMAERQELLQGGGGLPGGVQEHVGAGGARVGFERGQAGDHAHRGRPGAVPGPASR
jgi:hypothetical protein